MKKLMTLMMSISFALMLGCSAIVFSRTHSSHLTSIDTTYFTRISTQLLTDSLTELTNTVDTVYSQAYSQLFASTLDYVSRISKVSCTDKEIIANEICKVALENNIDICFILAQGTVETHLGATGIGRSRHSIFGVYRTYKDYGECIRSYAKILKKSYLVNGRTENDLLRKYVTARGARYAADLGYEKKLAKAVCDIHKSHGILRVTQEILRSYNYAEENQKLTYQDSSLADMHYPGSCFSQDMFKQARN